MPTSNLQVSTGLLRDRLLLSAQSILSERGSVTWRDLAGSRQLSSLYGRCVMIRTGSQMAAARALMELEGVARRIVLCPPELPDAECLYSALSAGVEVVILDEPWNAADGQDMEHVLLAELTPTAVLPAFYPAESESQDVSESGPERPTLETEWILLTSGTTDAPKLVVHTFSSLTCGIERKSDTASAIVWSTFYDIRRYGGLQIFLRAALTGSALVLSSKEETVAQFLTRAGAAGVTHISGTPSHWRRALMSTYADRIAPRYVRLSGEIADQAILDQLRHQYPQAAIVHAFASTEAGVAFEVSDGLAGVPADQLHRSSDVEIKMEAETLRVRSPRNASRYLDETRRSLKGDDGFVNTKDVLTLHDGRYFFAGRQDGVINVGGLKVHPEEVESVLNSHPEIRHSFVHAKCSPVVGALVAADVLLRVPQSDASESAKICREVLAFCREKLPAYKVPVSIRPVLFLPIADTGKLARTDA